MWVFIDIYHIFGMHLLYTEVTKQLEAFERRMMLKLEILQNNFDTAISKVVNLLEARPQPFSIQQDLSDLLQEPCKTVEALESLCLKLTLDSSFKKRMVSAVTFLSGYKWHSTVTDILICTDTHPVSASWSEPGGWCAQDAAKNWEQFTLESLQPKGKKGKEAFSEFSTF